MPKKKSRPKIKKIPAKVAKYIEQSGLDHEIYEHRTVYSAIDAAATLKKKLSEIAKSLLVKADRDWYVLVLPGDNDVDFDKVKKAVEKESGKAVKAVRIPGEKMVENALKIKNGAVTAFGKLHKVSVMVDSKFARSKKAVFATGSNMHSIEARVKDFIALEEPLIAPFGKQKKIKKLKQQKPKRKK